MRPLVPLLVVILLASAGASAPAAAEPQIEVTTTCSGGPAVRVAEDGRDVKVLLTRAGRHSAWGGSSTTETTFGDGTGVTLNASLALRSDGRGRIRTTLGSAPAEGWSATIYLERRDGRARCLVTAASGG